MLKTLVSLCCLFVILDSNVMLNTSNIFSILVDSDRHGSTVTTSNGYTMHLSAEQTVRLIGSLNDENLTVGRS